MVKDSAYLNARTCLDRQLQKDKESFIRASKQTIESLLILEPGLTAQKNEKDQLSIRIATDSEGIEGDVRDVIFERKSISPRWEVGFSAKNNHEAVKHSRLSMSIDFGEKWMGLRCSKTYFSKIKPVFDLLSTLKSNRVKWRDLNDKDDTVYVPLLTAFREEMLQLSKQDKNMPQKLLSYLIGHYPFYKIIKDDRYNLVIVKAFNLGGALNKTVNKKKAFVRTEHIKFPTRIIELDFLPGSKTTLMMVMDEGWQVSFRIHNASTYVETSLKFDIQLIGNPPILFTQNIFNIDTNEIKNRNI